MSTTTFSRRGRAKAAAAAGATPNLVAARDLILKTLGAPLVAEWLGVRENTVYQWLSRGTDGAPFPIERSIKLAERARAEGRGFDLRVLIPGWLL